MPIKKDVKNLEVLKKLEDLFMEITYNVKKGKFKITGTLNKVGQKTVLENFIRSQFGEGVDNRKPKIKDVYHIRLAVDLSYDILKVKYDTGNMGLRDGILMDVYSKLE